MSETIEQSRETDTYVQQFGRFERQDGAPGWLCALRRRGIDSFREQGLPVAQDEDWRFTNLAPVRRLPFHPVFESHSNGSARQALERDVFAALSGNRLVFVDGRFSQELSTLRPMPGGAEAISLAAALDTHSDFLEKHLGRYAVTRENAFAALNQAYFLDGAFIRIPAGVRVEEPIQLVFISSAAEAGATVQPRNLIVAGAGSEVTIIETFLTSGEAPSLTNAVTELVVEDNATVELLKLQDEAPNALHMATLQGEFGRSSNARVHSFALGSRLSRNNIRARLAGEGLECILNGLYLTRDEQTADHHMIVEHAQPHCASHEYFNGILDDRSRGVFHGRIYVHPVAQKTDAKQTNKNLLLSDDAVVDTKPQLEIYADDVKCTHGATVGQLNDESIFYLRTRGIGPEMARRMLIHAFAGEIIERVRCQPVRETLDKLVWYRLEANPHLAEKK